MLETTNLHREWREYFRKISPGTEFRDALIRIQAGHTGALIVVGDGPEVLAIVNGGFMMNADFSAPRLAELCKMDGAVIVDYNFSVIRFANVHLVPDPSIPTKESGTRHRTAERVARQTGCFVIAVSETLDRITLYKGARKYILQEPRVIVIKANQALQTLEKYKSRLEQVSSTLYALELEDLVTIMDVSQLLQRSEMLRRIADEIAMYVGELGTEGRLVDLQMGELMGGVLEDEESVIRDYLAPGHDVEKAQQTLGTMSEQDLLQLANVAAVLGYPAAQGGMDRPLSPRGYRMLRRIPRLPTNVIDNLVNRFKSARDLMRATKEELDDVEGVGPARAQAIRDGLQRISEALIIDRYL
ncbi:MAG: DNA integrity scanning diadenylate cyclase DisA [Candidatus Geothermincolia bacterium]